MVEIFSNVNILSRISIAELASNRQYDCALMVYVPVLNSRVDDEGGIEGTDKQANSEKK